MSPSRCAPPGLEGVRLKTADDSKQLSIGEPSTRTGKARSAIRFYEEIGLIPAPIRIGGRRRYPVETIRTLAVIDTAQRATLTLDEIRLLLRASADDRLAIDEWKCSNSKESSSRASGWTRPCLDSGSELKPAEAVARANCSCPERANGPIGIVLDTLISKIGA
jgi:DNA-binding transcriptional MerR regulator